MNYLQHHLEHILAAYTGSPPLHHFLKAYFKKHPKLGSRDRRGLSDAVYSWYRVGKSLQHPTASPELLRLAALQLCGLRPRAFEAGFPPEWPTATPELPGQWRISTEEIFPFDIPLSEGIRPADWLAAFRRQPRLFLRIRHHAGDLKKILEEKNIPHEWLRDTCLALPNGTKVEHIFPEASYVVQDASSQACAPFLQGHSGEYWWDCCAGAGGKSLLLAEGLPGIRLLASDLRPGILANLVLRFRRYGLPLPECVHLDAAEAPALSVAIGRRQFDGIICDVPCSGSGTWARNPENCFFFQPETLKDFAQRQQNILQNAAQFLAPAGRILYITCSVFRCENEAVVQAAAEACGLQIHSMQLLNGLAVQADSLFLAELRKA